MELVLYGSIAWRDPLGLGQVIRWANQYGWDAIDARGMSLDIPGDIQQRVNAFGYDMLGPRQVSRSARRELRSRLADSGLHLLGIYCSSPVNLTGELGRACRKLFCEYLQLGADLEVQWIRAINNTTMSYDGPELSPQQAYERTVEGLRELGRQAATLGVGLLLENNENTVTPDAESLGRLQRDLGEICRVGIAYDPVNAYFQGLDPEAGLELLAGRIDVLHLKNVRRTDSPLARGGYVPRGDFSYQWTGLAEGDLDWQSLLARARAGRFDGPLVYEYVNPFKGMPPEYWDQLPEPEQAAEVTAAFLRGVVT